MGLGLGGVLAGVLASSGSALAGGAGDFSENLGAKAGLENHYSAKGGLTTPSAKGVYIPEKMENAPRGGWEVRAGAQWRQIGGLSVAPAFGGNGLSFRQLPVGPGPRGVAADRTYDDGFVNTATGTPATGLTTAFGYQNTPTIAGGEVIFSRAGGVQVATASGGTAGDDGAVAPVLELAWLTPVNDALEVGVAGNFSWLGLDQGFGQDVVSSTITVRDGFDLAGVVLPAAPYNGQTGVASVLIPNVPTSRQEEVVAVGTERFNFSSDVDLFSLAIGPEVRWRVTERFSLTGSGGVVLNFADWTASAQVPNVVAGAVSSTEFRADDEEFLWGAWVQAAAEVALTERWSVRLFGRYDWSEDLEGAVGPTEFEVDLSGWSVGGGLGYRF